MKKVASGFYEFFDGLLAIGEEKVSTLCVAFFFTLGFAIYKFIEIGSIDNNMKDIIITFILSLVGSNGINKITNTAMQVKNIKDSISNNNPYNNMYDNYGMYNEDINNNELADPSQLNRQNDSNSNLPKDY